MFLFKSGLLWSLAVNPQIHHMPSIASALVSFVDGSANDHATVLDQHLGQVPTSTGGEFKHPASHLALAAFLVQKVHHSLLRNLPCFQQAVIHVMISWRKKRNHWANSFKQLFLPAQPAIHLDPCIHLQCTVVFLVRIHVYVQRDIFTYCWWKKSYTTWDV